MFKKGEKICHKGHDQSEHAYYAPDGKYKACRTCKNETTKRWYEKMYQENPDWQIRKHLKQNWDMTLEEYNKILELQGNCCAICKTTDFGDRRGAVDHCHTTGKIRGILCDSCNNGLGRFKDDIESLKEAILYLEKDW